MMFWLSKIGVDTAENEPFEIGDRGVEGGDAIIATAVHAQSLRTRILDEHYKIWRLCGIKFYIQLL